MEKGKSCSFSVPVQAQIYDKLPPAPKQINTKYSFPMNYKYQESLVYLRKIYCFCVYKYSVFNKKQYI